MGIEKCIKPWNYLPYKKLRKLSINRVWIRAFKTNGVISANWTSPCKWHKPMLEQPTIEKLGWYIWTLPNRVLTVIVRYHFLQSTCYFWAKMQQLLRQRCCPSPSRILVLKMWFNISAWKYVNSSQDFYYLNFKFLMFHFSLKGGFFTFYGASTWLSIRFNNRKENTDPTFWRACE